MGNDLRVGVRMLAKSPGFTILAVTALALGIGANTAIFSVVNAVMLRRMPFENPQRLAMIWEESPRTSRTNVVNPNNFLAWQARNHSFERMAAFVEFDVGITGDGEPEVVSNLAVSDGFFQILGVQPLLGRWFTAREDSPANDNVAILSEGFWRRRYGADRNILGRKIAINTREYAIVGVMPDRFRFPKTKADLWQPLGLDGARSYGGRYLMTIARLREGVAIDGAQAEMNGIAAQLQRERPEFDSKWGITVSGLREQAVGDVRKPLLVLLSAVGLVLLIACANVANLMLMRAAGRGREVAIRTAVGASAGRIVRQLLIESLLLALMSGAAGLGIGIWMMDLLRGALPDTIDYATLKDIPFDTTVFLFAAAVSLATGLLFGLTPALKAARMDVQQALRDGGRAVAGQRSMIRQALVVAEVALSMTLLIGAGLLIRSFARLASVDPGFDARHVLSMQLSVARRFPSGAKMAEFTAELLNRVRALPGVEAAGASHFLPLGRIIPGTGFWRADRPQPNRGEEPVTDVLVVMPGYFAAMRTPVLRGRVFDGRDRADVPHRVVINQALARRFFPNESPVGKVLAVEWGKDPYEIIGVVGDVHQDSLDAEVKSEVFICNLQEPTGPVYLVARTHGNPRALAKPIEAEVHALNQDIPISDVKTMDEYVGDAVAEPRFHTILLGGFSVLALVLAAVGIFGVISYSVAQRTKEIGLRLALGAERGSVMRLMVAQGMGLAGAGIAAGLGGSVAVMRILQTLLFGVTPTDTATFAGAAVILGLVALAACYLPARRAAAVDPMETLRHE
jgi:putative ABC transport system permease protein